MLSDSEHPVTGRGLRKAIYGRWLLTQWAIGAKLLALELGSSLWLDGTDSDVSQPGWWHCCYLCRGISPL